MNTTQPRLVAVDWGTSNLRVSLIDDDGRALETRSAAGGVMAVRDGAFEQTLLPLCSDWLADHGCALIASGMIGSRQGWQEAPYIDCPARLDDAAERLVSVRLSGGHPLFIVPGLRHLGRDGEYDVMRGEETQLWGVHAQSSTPTACVLPGTHSKWAWLDADGGVARFSTYMTGELYGLLTRHGILGRLMTLDGRDAAAFDAGIRRGLVHHAALSHAIFAARTAGLMERLGAASLPDFLSGILIGAEIAAALGSGDYPGAVVVIGDDELSARYERGLSLAGVSSTRAASGVTTAGQCAVARRAGLVAAR